MGRIKTKEITRTANQILEMHGEKFSATYDANKEVFRSISKDLGITSKWLTNRILGHITNVKRREADAKK